jgi:hypothetical protein
VRTVAKVWETLSDPARRAAYDAMAGFSIDSVNPFVDTSHERDQVGRWMETDGSVSSSQWRHLGDKW